MIENQRRERAVRREAESLLEQVQAIGPVMKASLVKRKFKCGKDNCRCNRGALHEDMVVTRKVGGKTQTVRVRKGREREAMDMVANWRRHKQLVDQLTAVQLELLRLST